MQGPVSADANAEQAAYWNGLVGQRWTKRQEFMDGVLAPVSSAVIERAAAAPGEWVIDIGCGCGATSVELAERAGMAGRVLGVDISEPMLARARERAPAGAPLTFVAADATVYPFEPQQTDLLFSRFGVMFFARPSVSFANMRTALRAGGRLVFVCWREARLNPWLVAPVQAAYLHVPKMPELGPEDPGPFSFANPDRVRRILAEAGFGAITFEPLDFTLDLANGQGLDAAVENALEIGPASRALDGQPAELQRAAERSIREALAAKQAGQSVPLAAAVWIVSASNP
jgi:SAM-dependent methyltransferase